MIKKRDLMIIVVNEAKIHNDAFMPNFKDLYERRVFIAYKDKALVCLFPENNKHKVIIWKSKSGKGSPQELYITLKDYNGCALIVDYAKKTVLVDEVEDIDDIKKDKKEEQEETLSLWDKLVKFIKHH